MDRLDPDVPDVEALLTAAAARHPAPGTTLGGVRLRVEHALWICACVTPDDAPNWLVYATADGGLGWTRVPDGTDPLGLVDARFSAGGHAAPSEVLDWLRDPGCAPYDGGGGGEHRVVREGLSRLLHDEGPSSHRESR